MKLYSPILFFIYITATPLLIAVSQKSLVSENFYYSHSPYVTPGYLRAWPERRYALYGPSPYITSRKITLDTFPIAQKHVIKRRVYLQAYKERHEQ